MHENGLSAGCGFPGALPDGSGDAWAVPTAAAFPPVPGRGVPAAFLLAAVAVVGGGWVTAAGFGQTG